MEYIIDIDNFNIEKIIKKTKSIKNKCDRKNLILKFNIKEPIKDEILLRDIKSIETAINLKTKEERYNYIYDTVCGYLDDRIINENYCEFKDDVCIKFREEDPSHKNGCCEFQGRGKCKYLIDSVCTMKTCMACKLFTCKYLYNHKGIRQRINDYVLIKYFFNNNQKYILECSFWTPKEIVMKRLLANNYNIKK
jgi:hypothetical protein